MHFDCPYCRKQLNLEEMQMDADIAAIIKLQPVFGKQAHLVWAYCELFGIMPLKARRKKLRVLQEEMKTLFQAEEFFYQKRRYRISQAGIIEALNVMVHKHWDSHLENHNYLKKIMIGQVEASAKTESREAEKDLRKREEQLRYPYHEEQVEPPMGGGPAGAILKPMPAAQLTEEQIAANKKRVREIMDGIGD